MLRRKLYSSLLHSHAYNIEESLSCLYTGRWIVISLVRLLAPSGKFLKEVIALLLPGVEETLADISILLGSLLQENLFIVAIVSMLEVDSEGGVEDGELCDAVSHARAFLD
jgi:hypothetical protein